VAVVVVVEAALAEVPVEAVEAAVVVADKYKFIR